MGVGCVCVGGGCLIARVDSLTKVAQRRAAAVCAEFVVCAKFVVNRITSADRQKQAVASNGDSLGGGEGS